MEIGRPTKEYGVSVELLLGIGRDNLYFGIMAAVTILLDEMVHVQERRELECSHQYDTSIISVRALF